MGRIMDGSRAGAPRWPASPELLADAHYCPACFRDVRPPVCPDCGFVFSDGRAVEVLALGRQMLNLETERRQLIGAIRLTAVLDAKRAAAAAARASAVAAARISAVVAPADAAVVAPADAAVVAPGRVQDAAAVV